jgi:hypothetical protein
MFGKLAMAAALLSGIGAVSTSAAAAAPMFGFYIASPVQVAAYPGPQIERYRVRGRVAYFNRFVMNLWSQGREVRVNLHQGTIIQPLGLTLQPGMFVAVDGYWAPGGFHADRIRLIH